MTENRTPLSNLEMVVGLGLLITVVIPAGVALLFVAGYNLYIFGGSIGCWSLSEGDRAINNLEVYDRFADMETTGEELYWEEQSREIVISVREVDAESGSILEGGAEGNGYGTITWGKGLGR